MILFENSYRSFRTKHLQNKKNATEIEEDKHRKYSVKAVLCA